MMQEVDICTKVTLILIASKIILVGEHGAS